MSPRFLLALLIVTTFAGGLFAGNPVDIHGRLQAKGNRIVGEKSGDTVQLTGMSFFWNQWPEGSIFYNAKTAEWVIDDFHASVLRAAIGVGEDGKMAADSAASYGQLDAVVSTASRRGVYSIVDWHAHYAPKNVAASKIFFENVSKKYGNNPGVIFELFNEPWADVYTWTEIKAYAEQIIPVIRKNSKNLILVGTRQWSRIVDEASLDPIKDDNVAYVLHFYAGSHGDTVIERGRKALANGVPVFVSEWGTTNSDGGTVDKAIYPDTTNAWFAWMDSNKISSCNWSIQNKGEASAILKAGLTKLSGWSDSELTPSGRFVRELIRARNVQYTFELPPIDSSKLPGRIQAEAFSAKKELDVSPGAADDSSRYLMNSQTTSWAEYDVTVPFRKKGVVALRAGTAKDGAAPIIKFDGKQVAKIAIKNTGNWSTYAIATSDSIIIPAGKIKVRIEYNGQFDFDWFEITGRKYVEGEQPPEPPKSDSLRQTVRVEAEDAIKLNSLTKEPSGDEDGTQSLGYTTDSSWAEFKALLPKGRQIVAVRVASEMEGATLKISINGTAKTSIKCAGTGGWQTWKTVVASDSITLDLADSALVRVDWEDGEGRSSLVNLNWIEFRAPEIVQTSVRPRTPASAFRAVATSAGISVELSAPVVGEILLLDPRGRILSRTPLSGSTASIATACRGLVLVRVQGTDGFSRSVPVVLP